MQLNSDDILKFAAAAIPPVAFTLLWVHGSKQRSVSRSVAASLRITVWLLGIHAGWFYVLCVMFSTSTYAYFLTTAIIFLIAAAVKWDLDPGASDPIGIAVIMAVILPLYILKQLVLGFPDRELVIHVPDSVPLGNDPPIRKSDTGTAVSTLRPMGTIELAGELFNARSATGIMIQAGNPVRVTGHRSNILLVIEFSPDEPTLE